MSNLIAMVHVACRDLGISAEDRQDIQRRLTGKASLKDMTQAELTLVVDHMKDRGFKPTTNGGGRRKAAPRKDLRYVHVLWRLLGEAGALTKPGRDGLNAFVRSRFEGKWKSVPIDIDSLRDPGQINDVIRALRDMCARHDVEVHQ